MIEFTYRGRHIIMLHKLNILFYRIALRSVLLLSKCSTLANLVPRVSL